MQGHRTKDFWAGVTYITLGLATIVLGRDLPMGTAARMGAGYFPTVLGGLLAMLGVISAARGLTKPGAMVPRRAANCSA